MVLNSGVPPLALSRFTRNGITSVVGLLGTNDATRHPRELVTAVNGLRAEGLSAWCYTAGYHVPPVTVTGSIRSDIAQIDAMIGVKTAISDHRSSCRRASSSPRTSTGARHCSPSA